MISSVAGMSKKLPAWTREFDNLVRAIGECKSKAQEDAIICREIEILKPRLKDAKLDKRLLKETMVRLIYVEMLGHDASWGHVKALQACSDQNLLTKKVAYLASSLFLDHSSDLIILVVNTITQDLKSDNYLTGRHLTNTGCNPILGQMQHATFAVCSALTAACKLIGSDLINALLPATVELLTHPKELVRKKAVMLLHRFQQLDPAHDGPLHSIDLGKHFRQALCDKDPSVMSAALCGLLEVTSQDPKPYRNLIPSFVSILKQVAEHRLPKAFDYHRTPAPFIQIKLLRILTFLGAGDKSASENMYAVVGDAMRRANTGHTIGNAIIAECVRTVTAIYPNEALQQSAAEMISTFLKASSHNLKYVGIDALSRIVRINAKYANEHQLAVIDCLEDPDESLKRKTLELLFKMTNPNNVEVIVEKMIDYLRSTSDEVQKADVVKRLSELAERFAPDTQWFIDIMNQVFQLGGDVVEPALADSLARLIAEGAGEDDAAADTEVRAQAVSSYLKLLEEPKLPDILLQVICWVLGEYGTISGSSAGEVMDQLADIPETQTVSDAVRGYMLTAFGKLAAQSGASMTAAAHEILQSASRSANPDLQQRALELQALLSLSRGTQQRAFPSDASCEDIDVDANLSFLTSFVQTALQNGAAPYISEADRFEMGAVRQSHNETATDQSHALRFTAYERTSAPEPVSVRTISRDPSPIRETGFSGAPVAEMTQPRVAVGGGEPQLAVKSTGRQRWGPATFSPPSVQSPAATLVSSSTGDRYVPSAAATPASSSYNRPISPEPEVPAERAKLAGLLFGRGEGPRSSRSKPAPKRVTSPGDNNKPEANPVATNLLDFGGSESLEAAPVESSKPASSGDPFAILEGLDHPAQVPVPLPQAGSKPVLDLDALYGGGYSAQLPPIQQASQADPFGLGGLAAPKPAASYETPRQSSGGGYGIGGAGSDPFGLGAPAAAQPQRPTDKPGPAPMVPRGNAAVKQKIPKNDPFADLFG